jgi:hypothetical protein
MASNPRTAALMIEGVSDAYAANRTVALLLYWG